jgi:hypothetical protein
VEETVKEQLDLYCNFMQCGRQHVVDQALRLLFERDADFQAWLARRSESEHGQAVGAG